MRARVRDIGQSRRQVTRPSCVGVGDPWRRSPWTAHLPKRQVHIAVLAKMFLLLPAVIPLFIAAELTCSICF